MPLVVEHEVAHLPVHLLHRRPIDLPVVPHVRVAVRDRRVGVLHVRHVDVDDAVEQGERLEAVVAAGVVDERQVQALARRDGDGRKDLRHDVARRHQVDVVAAHGLQGEHHLRQLVGADRAPRPLLADVPVLAEHAAQVAPGEEDGAGAAPATQRRFLAVVRAVARHHRLLAGPADRALDALEAIHPAIAGAQVAGPQVRPGRVDPLVQDAGRQQLEIGGAEHAGRGEDGPEAAVDHRILSATKPDGKGRVGPVAASP